MLSRHPRFILSLAFLILCTFLLLARNNAITHRGATTATVSNPLLQERLSQSEEVYQGVLAQRKAASEPCGPTTGIFLRIRSQVRCP